MSYPSFFFSFLCNPAGREPSERSGGYKSALDGLVVKGMMIQNAGGECIRLRGKLYFPGVRAIICENGVVSIATRPGQNKLLVHILGPRTAE